MTEPALLDIQPLARRSPLAISLLVHAGFVCLCVFWSRVPFSAAPVRPVHRRSILVVRLGSFQPKVAKAGSSSAAAGGSAQGTSRASLTFHPQGASPQADVSRSSQASGRAHASLEVSPSLPKRPVRQTIIQVDVPPDVVLKQEIPLANVLSWQPQPVVPFKKQFVAPPLKEMPRKAAQNMPAAPQFELPNRENAVSDLKMAAALSDPTRRFVLPPSTTSPVRMPRPETINQTPQIALPPSNQPSAALIAMVESPVRPEGVILVPPANQVAAPGSAGQASGQGDHESRVAGEPRNGGSGKGGGPTTASGPGSGSQTAVGDGAGKTGDGRAAGGTGSGTGQAAQNGAGASLAGLGSGLGKGNSASSSTGAEGAGTEDPSQAFIDSLRRITLPKEGTFGVVVLGSSQASPYPESAGALSGKIIYTVYLAVGMHKKWILQYCLPKAAEGTGPRGSATPIDAPWPFLMFRPQEFTGSSDYVIVHGMINTEGRFDQLAMVFPDEFEQKDLLIKSLKLWSFRPASRDRQPTEVEVLLIIPTES
jgi:hypothetical protein